MSEDTRIGSPYLFPNTQRRLYSITGPGNRLYVAYPVDANEMRRARDLNAGTVMFNVSTADGTNLLVLGEYRTEYMGESKFILQTWNPAFERDTLPIDGISNQELLRKSNIDSKVYSQALNLATRGQLPERLPEGLVPRAIPAPMPPPNGAPTPTPTPPTPPNLNPTATTVTTVPVPVTATGPTSAAGAGAVATAPEQAPATASAPEQGSTSIQPASPVTATKPAYLSYPLNMKPEQDKIRFQAVKVKKRTVDASKNYETSAFSFEFGKPTFEKIENVDPIFLSIQSSITDQNSVDWGPDSINPIESALFYKSLGFMQSNTSDEMGAKIQGFLGGIMTEFKRKQGYFQTYLAGQAAGNANVVSRTDGVILNPNMELLFTGPQLRPFTFQFKMSAREKKEAENIKEIIKYFKKNMAVSGPADGGFFLKSPNVFQISYLKWDEKQNKYINHPGLNLIHAYGGENELSSRACALTNCSVDYTPLGSYATYDDGTMVSYNISLQFQDLTPIYQSDYDSANHPIGY